MSDRLEHSLVVVGSTNRDTVISVRQRPEAGETVLGTLLRRNLGGKGANQAIAAARADGRPLFITALGKRAERLQKALEESGVELYPLGDRELDTGEAIITVTPDGQNSILVVQGANASIEPVEVSRAIGEVVFPGTLVLLQCELSSETVSAAIAAAHRLGGRVILNLAPYVDLPAETLAVCDPLVVNESEASSLLGMELNSVEDAIHAGLRLATMCISAVITLGADGAVAVWREHGEAEHQVEHLLPPDTEIVDTTGAGDAFVGTLAATLAAGEDLLAAVAEGNRAGALAVSYVGSQPRMETAAR